MSVSLSEAFDVSNLIIKSNYCWIEFLVVLWNHKKSHCILAMKFQYLEIFSGEMHIHDNINYSIQVIISITQYDLYSIQKIYGHIILM